LFRNYFTVQAQTLRIPISSQTANQGELNMGTSTQQSATAGVRKEVFLPDPGSIDPVAHSISENLFWTDQLMEHATFFIMLMPGDELADERARAKTFQTNFADQFAKTRNAHLDRDNFAAFNQSTIELVKPFLDFKAHMGAEQLSGRLQSLVWPSFFDHTLREATRFVQRLEQFSRGDVAISRGESSAFWTTIMGEHAGFIAHLLDPEERELVTKALAASEEFHNLHANRPDEKELVIQAVNDIIDFKVAAEKGIELGSIKSIISPTLADHVRREALKAADELNRAS
jgi:hypothetical protein